MAREIWGVLFALGAGCGRIGFGQAGGGGGGDGGARQVKLTQSLAQDVVTGNSINCNQNGVQGDNSYYRVFDLSASGIAGELDVTEIDFGVELASAPGGEQQVAVTLHTLSGTFVLADLHAIATAQVAVADQANAIVHAPITGSVPAGATLVVEIHPPPHTGNLLIGSNAQGQTGPSYLRAPDPGCDRPEPTDLATIGSPNMDIVLDVLGLARS